jgi:eukaryotic-like serine/threonine-protein kinase
MATLPAGTLVGGKYKIETVVAQLQSSTVYGATDTRTGQPIFLKMLLPMLAKDREDRGRFEREFDLMNKLRHQTVASVFEMANADDGVPFMSMEAMQGESLAKRLERGPLPPKEALALTMQLLDGLRQAHANRIIHRDVQPGALFVVPRADGFPQLKIISFGQARLEGQATATGPGQALTAYCTTVGSPEYMSPEQAKGGDIDGRSDLYSVGCVAYAMLTGAPPFPGKQTAMVIVRHMKEEPKPVSSVKPGVPPWFDTFVMRCLRKKPEERFESVADARQQLENAMAGGVIAPPPESWDSAARAPDPGVPSFAQARPTGGPVAARPSGVAPTAAAPAPGATTPRPVVAAPEKRPTMSAASAQASTAAGGGSKLPLILGGVAVLIVIATILIVQFMK